MFDDFFDTDSDHGHYGGKPFLLITGLGQGLMLIGVLATAVFGLIFWMENDSKSWETVPGIVRESEGRGDDKQTLRFAYSYEVKGRSYKGSAVVYEHRLLNGDCRGNQARATSRASIPWEQK